MRRRSFLAGAAAALAAPALAQPARVVKSVPISNIGSVDPIWTTSYAVRNHGYMVWDTLYGSDEAGAVRPQMAAGHEFAADGRSCTIRLRDGLKFHDGAPVRAQDCVASLARWMRRDTFGQFAATVIDEMREADDRTIAIRLKRSFPGLIAALGKPSSNVPFIMPERLAATDPFRSISVDDVVGSGPFRFVRAEFQTGARIVYARNPDYVPRSEPPSGTAGGKVVKVDRVEWHVISDGNTALAALQSGEIDMWEEPLADLIPVLRRNRAVKVEVLNTLGVFGFMRFNQLHPPFDKVGVRRAVLNAVNQADYLAAMMGTNADLTRPCYSVFICGSPMASEAGADGLRAPSIERARQMLEQAGYNGERVLIVSPTDSPTVHAAGLVTEQLLRRLGMNVELRATDFGTLVQVRGSREPGAWNIFHSNQVGADAANPAVSNLIRGNALDAFAGWPSEPRLEALRDQWMVASDEAEARRIAEEIQKVAMEAVPFVPLGQYFLPAAYRTNLGGLVRAVAPVYWNIEKT